VRARVEEARGIQSTRYAGRGVRCNAEMGGRELAESALLDGEARSLLCAVGERLGLSARVYGRVLKVARTIADLAGEPPILKAHVSEALMYRMYRCLDRPL
jgi:magnesium chelatase family protein